MEAIRIIKKPVEREITIKLPQSFLDEEVEIIVLPLGRKEDEQTKFDPQEFLGFMKQIDMNVREELKRMREEWERSF